MDDHRLSVMLEMAQEAEALDRDLSARVVVHPAREDVRRVERGRPRGRPALSALAVVALLGLVTVLGARATRLWRPGAAPSNAGSNAGAIVERPDVQNMLIALYRGEDGHAAKCPECWCVQHWSPELEGGLDVTRVADAELIGASMERACVSDPARMVIIGLTGPADLLPHSDEQAREVAMCLLDSGAAEHAAAGAVDVPTSTTGCLAADVSYRIQTWNR